MSSIAKYPFYNKTLAFAFCFIIYAMGSIQASTNNNLINIETVIAHDDFDLDKIKAELEKLMNEYISITNKQQQKEVVLSIENELLSQIKMYPKHEKEILDAARTMIEKGSHNWIILRNKTQLKINVMRTAQSKG